MSLLILDLLFLKDYRAFFQKHGFGLEVLNNSVLIVDFLHECLYSMLKDD